MCGRYYMDEETYLDIQKIVSEVEVSFGRELITGDIHPTEAAPVIVSPAHKKLQLCKKAWGYPEWQNKGVIFNARVESVTERTPLYLAGFYDRFGKEDRFVILTTAANASMSPVHDRMPLILEKDQIIPWLWDEKCAKEILSQTPALLERYVPYEQQRLF